VRVRRSSNNGEQDFTAASISSGALVNFVNEIQTLGTVTNSSGNNGFTLTNTSSTGFTATTDTATGVCGWPYTAKAGDKITVSFDAVVRSGTPQFLPRRATALSSNNLASVVSDSPLSVNSTASYSFEFTYDDDQAGSLTFSEGDDNADFDISNFQVTSFKGAGFVETWYDQSGNGNDAVQATAGSQPKIVNAGSLVVLSDVPALLFDESFFVATGFAFSPSGDFLAVTASKLSSNNFIDTRDGGSDGFFIQQGGSDVRYRYNGDGSIDVSGNDQHIVATAELNGTTLTAYKNGSSAGTDTVTAGLSTTTALSIGKVAFSSANTLTGSVQEIILYDTDKSANRAVLETNIISHYGIS
jgi:hypothetical protein